LGAWFLPLGRGLLRASLMLRKLGSYPRKNGLALALREVGRFERTLFILQWLQDPDLRRRVQVGLNKCEARNALARAVLFNQLGEMRDRSFEYQNYRASGLNLVVSAMILWNTVYLERALPALKNHGRPHPGGTDTAPVTTWLGTHQFDRGLRLETRQESDKGGIQAAAEGCT
jgi:TnpA family transposase